ncbi:regulator of hemoglobinization and erythroid cell expansion protein [Tupaia chinensis]|uniref:regulator of hemoglobinization and erythroid cell expansion protein n=1 Tax=Tupaia chinensis TaxID=246437 RepID=UPI0007047D39|nr:regulator of hemoglobinization and erythroid cell expansion protein [Tupaia chinensis]
MRDMKLWHGIAIAAVSLLLQTCLLAVISYLLSRHMVSLIHLLPKLFLGPIPTQTLIDNLGNACEEGFGSSSATTSSVVLLLLSLWGSAPLFPLLLALLALPTFVSFSLLLSLLSFNPAQLSLPEEWFLFSPDDSDTSSDSLDYSSSMPPTCQATKDVDYTQVAFLSPRGLKNVSSLDYENMTEATDYVNVDPKSRKLNLWTCVNPVVFEPVEYSQVAM